MLGVLGGTFDPVHNGHLHIAKSLYEQLSLKEVRFIPCKKPLLGKKVVANETQRLAMLKRALDPYPHFSIDEREIKRTTPSYTLETLTSLRKEMPNIPITLILGNDNLENLNSWYKWTALIEYAHLVIVPRVNHSTIYNQSIQTFMKEFQIEDPSLLSQQAAGLLFVTHVKPLAISATIIRQKIAKGLRPNELLPYSVLAYIYEQKLYL